MASYGSEDTWNGEEEEEEDHDQQKQQKHKEKKNNLLAIWGNERTMNLNTLILTNIQSSHYFKVDLYELKTYHEVIDEIYYKVQHLEPWEKGSRKTAGQTGMCGGVRGVGAGGIVSTAFCLLYKLFTLKLTRKQINGLITHQDSPYIRGLGFMYIRYTQPPADLWEWYDEYLDDAEELDVKAGGGLTMTVGTMLKNFLTKLEWFSTLFPRIPVPIQQKIQKMMAERYPPTPAMAARPPVRQQGVSGASGASKVNDDVDAEKYGRRRESPATGSGRERDRFSRDGDRERGMRDGGSFLRDSYRDRDVKPHRDAERNRDRHRDAERDRDRNRFQRDRSRDRERQRRHDPRDDRDRSHRKRAGSRERDREHRRHRDHDATDYRPRQSSYR